MGHRILAAIRPVRLRSSGGYLLLFGVTHGPRLRHPDRSYPRPNGLDMLCQEAVRQVKLEVLAWIIALIVLVTVVAWAVMS